MHMTYRARQIGRMFFHINHLRVKMFSGCGLSQRDKSKLMGLQRAFEFLRDEALFSVSGCGTNFYDRPLSGLGCPAGRCEQCGGVISGQACIECGVMVGYDSCKSYLNRVAIPLDLNTGSHIFNSFHP